MKIITHFQGFVSQSKLKTFVGQNIYYYRALLDKLSETYDYDVLKQATVSMVNYDYLLSKITPFVIKVQ